MKVKDLINVMYNSDEIWIFDRQGNVLYGCLVNEYPVGDFDSFEVLRIAPYTSQINVYLK